MAASKTGTKLNNTQDAHAHGPLVFVCPFLVGQPLFNSFSLFYHRGNLYFLTIFLQEALVPLQSETLDNKQAQKRRTSPKKCFAHKQRPSFLVFFSSNSSDALRIRTWDVPPDSKQFYNPYEGAASMRGEHPKREPSTSFARAGGSPTWWTTSGRRAELGCRRTGGFRKQGVPPFWGFL